MLPQQETEISDCLYSAAACRHDVHVRQGVWVVSTDTLTKPLRHQPN